jgi:hypothetical protein
MAKTRHLFTAVSSWVGKRQVKHHKKRQTDGRPGKRR